VILAIVFFLGVGYSVVGWYVQESDAPNSEWWL